MCPTDAESRAALRLQAERIERYRQGVLTDAEFRPLRVSYGLYYELEHTSYLQRIKLPGGRLRADQADAIAALADEFARGRIHFTTRQNVQLHWVGLENVVTLYERLHAVGITTRGAAGDSVRNVTVCPHSGWWPDEVFDVAPYAHAVHEHFLFHPLNLTFPRKFKIAFAGCRHDCVQAPVNDIGFYPHLVDGTRGFSVYVAGGLGPRPFLARRLRSFLPAEDILIVAEAMAQFWSRFGERANRKRARMKFLFQRLGPERFAAGVNELVEQIAAQRGAALRATVREQAAVASGGRAVTPPSPLSEAEDSAYARWVRTNVSAQKQAGYYAATILLPLGDLTGTQLRTLAALARRLGAGELRATTDQNLVLPWVAGGSLAELHACLHAADLAEPNALRITDVTACPGADYCTQAVSRSMGVATAIREHLRDHDGRVEDLGVFRVKVSGCPNACGQHHIGDIGLTGLAVKGARGQIHPHYSVLVGGCCGEGTATVGMRLPGRVPEEDVPAVVAAIAEQFRRQRRAYESFADFVRRVPLTLPERQ